MSEPAVGVNTSIGTAEESTYGTPVTVDRFYEFLSESLERRNRILTSNGIRYTAVRAPRRGARRVLSARDGGGDITMEVAETGFGRWFKHLLGGTPVTTGSGPYTHTITMGSLLNKSLTVQKVLRDGAGTAISPFTFHGVKILSGEFSISVDQILQLALSVDAEDVETSTAAASPSYSNSAVYHFAEGTLSVGGSTVANVTNASITVTNPLKTDRYYLGSAGLKAQPSDNDYPTITGSLSAEFLDLATIYNRFAADTGVALSLTFDGSGTNALTISVPEVHFTGETPKVGGVDTIVQNVPFEGAYDGTNAGISIVYVSSDATP